MHVVVVDLVINAKGAGRSNRTGVEVQSNKGECASMLSAIRTDELALAKPHVRLEREPVPGAHVCSATSYVRQAHEPVEIRDLRRIADISQRLGGIQRIMVDKDSVGFQPYDATWNWIWGDTSVFAVVIFISGINQLRRRETRSQHRPGRSTDEAAAA